MISKTPVATLRKLASKVDVEPELIENAYPCTALQASLLAANLQGRGNYVSTFVFDVSASSYRPHDVRNACGALYENTAILRTRFLQSRGSFLQAITATPLVWSEHGSLEEFLELDDKQQVQLGDALANFAWIEDVHNKTYMVWSLHHALYDEWSIDLLFSDLNKLLISQEDITTRPSFSRFIKAQILIDQIASKDFWKTVVTHVDDYSPILKDGNLLQTSKQIEFSGPLNTIHSRYQASTLAIAAWSIFIANLSESETVVFGNIVNGRTANIPGIVDICGPTMTTVPYVVKIPWDEPAATFLDRLEATRNNMLLYEQTGLEEYRRTTGSGRFDTLLSIRSAKSNVSADRNEELRPTTTAGRQVHHPCCIYLDVLFEAENCAFKAAFDEQYVDSDKVGEALEALLTCLNCLINGLKTTLKDLVDPINFPSIMLSSSVDNFDTSQDEQDITIDPSMLDVVRKAAQEVSPSGSNIQVGADTSLRELGFDSLTTVMFARKLGQSFEISLPFRELIGLHKTVADVTRSVQKTLHGTEQAQTSKLELLELAKQHTQEFQIPKTSSTLQKAPDCILLTGASGYVGIEILRLLLASCDNRIILLARCSNSDEGLKRMHRTAELAQWNENELQDLDSRTEVWPSDLGASNLGLEDHYLDQFKTIRTIIHNGARVDFSLDYHDLEAANVNATAFLLSQHLKSVPNPSFTYVTGGRGCPLDSGEPLELTASKLRATNGYAQTKFVSEVLVHHARDVCQAAGVSSTMAIVHPGAVIGRRDTGVANTDDFLWRYVAASVHMRAYVPAVPTKREWINLMPVDAVARETISAALQTINGGKVLRKSMRMGMSVSSFWQTIVKTLDPSYELEPVSEWEWLRRLECELDKEGPKHPLFALSQLLLQGSLKGIGGAGLRLEQLPGTNIVSSCEEAVVSNVKYLEKVGFFSRDVGESPEEAVFARSKR